MATNAPEPVLVHLGEGDPGTVALKRTFSGNFWGEKCKGYGVLLRNLKSGSSVSGHLADYLKERASLEKAYIAGLQKLHKSLQQITDAHLGTFYPMWVVLMKSVEERFALHEQYLTQLANIAKDVSDYGSKLDDKLKQNLKGEIDNAGKSLKTFARTINTIAKTKKTYEHSCEDVIDQTRELAKMKRLEGAKAKDIEKLEAKLKKARAHLDQTQADHVKSIEHHKLKLEEYKEYMAKACTKFQALEEEHLDQLLSFMTVIAQADESKYSKLQQEANKNMEKVGALSIQQLINIFSQTRGTGAAKPTPYRFREVDLEAMISAGPRPDLAPIKAKKLRAKKPPKEAKGGKKTLERGKTLAPEVKSGGVNGVTEGTPTPHEDSPEVDEEGYSIRPTDADKVSKFLDEVSSQSSSSDSDFDSDDEPEFRLRKIKIKDIAVKPDEGNINDLMGAAAKLSLDAPPPSSGMKKATSSQSLKANITSMIARAPSPVGSQSLFEGASGGVPPNNALSPAGSIDTETSQQSLTTFSLGNFSLPEPLLPTLPTPSELGSTDLSAPLPSVSSSWASFDSPSPMSNDPACDTSAPDHTQPLSINWAESSLGKADSGTSQEEGLKPVVQPVAVHSPSPDLDPMPKTQSSPALLKAAAGEVKKVAKDDKLSSLSGPTLLPPPSSNRVSKRRSKISLTSHKPSALLSSIPPPAFASQTPLDPVASLPVASKLASESLGSHSDSPLDSTATPAASSTGDKSATLTPNHTPSFPSTLSPVLVPKPYSQGNESPLPQGKAAEHSPATAGFSSTPVTTPNASPILNPVRTAASTRSPLANVSISNAPSLSSPGGGGVVIPIAVAIHETCNAIFKGSKSIVKVTGEVMFSFPLGYVSQFASHAPLRFVVSEANMVTRLIHNQNYLVKEQDDIFIFQMEKLSVYLKQFLQNQSAHVQFCNLPALKYDMSFTDVTKLPLQLSCSWKCDSTSTNYQLNLTYVASHLPLSPKPALTSVTATVSVDGGVTSSQSSPSGLWSQEHGKLLWNVGEMRPAENPVPVTLRSKFELSSGPSTPKPTVVQFLCDGSTLSGMRLKLDTQAYKVSLYKNKVIAGKYMVEQVPET